MSGGDEIGRAFCRFLAEIAEREKAKAIQKSDYSTALVATVLEGLFREAEHTFT
jgi:hypothetical protein